MTDGARHVLEDAPFAPTLATGALSHLLAKLTQTDKVAANAFALEIQQSKRTRIQSQCGDCPPTKRHSTLHQHQLIMREGDTKHSLHMICSTPTVELVWSITKGK